MATQNDPGDAPEEGEVPKKLRPGAPIEPRRVLRAIRRGRWWLLGAATIGVIAGALIAKFVVRHVYEASASMRFEGVAALDDEAEGDMHDARRDLPSRLESLRREAVLREVRTRMEMPRVSLAQMQTFFNNTQDAESGLVTITGHSSTPDGAARMANTIVEVFIEHERERRRQEIEAAILSLDERIRGAQAEIEAARARYDAFRAQHGVTDLTTEQESALKQATDRRAEADLAHAEIAALEARVAQLREEVRRTPRMQVVASSSESPDGAELARAEQHLQQLQGTLSNQHPRVQVAERQVRALRERMRGGGTRVTGSTTMGSSGSYETAQTALATASADLEATRSRAVGLARLAEEAQARVTSFSAIEGEAAALSADVQVKDRLLTGLQNNRSRLTNLLQNPDPGFRIIAAAVEPESAIPTKRKYYVAAGIPLGLVLLVLIVILVRELRGFKLHTATEVAWWGNGPVVGTTVWPRDPKAGGDLVADLDDYVPEAQGTMLIVGATEHETPLASELAKQLSSDWTDTTLLEMGGTARATIPDGRRPMLAASAGPSSAGVLGGSGLGGGRPLTPAEFEAAPTQVGSSIELLGPPTIMNPGPGYGMLNATPIPGGANGSRLVASAWEGPLHGQQLRRAARLADRVLVVVPSGAITAPQLTDIGTRLGRKEGVGYVVVGIAEEYATLQDRAGPIDEFWAAQKE
jgi:uncharacterized protein involved in exopolysaccharide biosynthesis